MSDDLYSVENAAGRVIEARVFALRTAEDANRYSAALAAQVTALGGRHPVLCADHRPVRIYPQEVTDRLVELFLDMNEQLERVAILVSPTNATLFLQLQRVVREAGYENRRVFHDPGEGIEFLGPVLDAREQRRAQSFLAEYPPR